MTNKRKNLDEINSPLLEAKLYIPPFREDSIPRLSLIHKLNEGIDKKLTLVSAPAGYGKTTLLSEWTRQCNMPVSWLSLNETDNDQFRFIEYLIAALRQVDENIGAGAKMMMQSINPLPNEFILAKLIKELTDHLESCALVLDDYHSIYEKEVNKMIEYLLENSPAKIHIVIATRVDPPFPLARFRVQQQINELRARDLSFSDREAKELFNQKMKLGLTKEEINILKNRTEGWIAGLQLAGLSMRSRDNTSDYVRSFAGDDRYIVDYLVEDVLNLQSEETLNFLLKTSVLSNLSGPLCDYVTGISGSEKILHDLEAANMFIIPLDDKRRWYRYHYLFAELLQKKLSYTDPEAFRDLHLKASEWADKNGFTEFAIEHAIAAEDFELAAGLITKLADALWKKGEISKMFKWFDILPEEIISGHLKIAVFYSWLLVKNGQYEKAEKILLEVEEILNDEKKKLTSGTAGDASFDFRDICGLASLVYASMSSIKKDEFELSRHANRALKNIAKSDLTARGIALLISAKALYQKQEINESIKAFSEARAIGEKTGNKNLYVESAFPMIAVAKFCGHFQQAVGLYKQLTQIVSEEELSQTLAGASVLYLWADVLQKQNKLNEALEYSTIAIETLEQGIDVGALCLGYFHRLKILLGKKDYQAAEELIEKMEKLEQENVLPLWENGWSMGRRARYWLEKGEENKFLDWLESCDFKIDKEEIAHRIPGRIFYMRYLISQGRAEDAITLGDNIIEILSIPEGNEITLEILLVKTTAYHTLGEREKALQTINEAMQLSEHRGALSFFISEGDHIRTLLESIDKSDNIYPQEFIEQLLSAFRLNEVFKTESKLENQLSSREMEVLNLIVMGLSNQQIVDELYISLSTVKTHVRKIFSKLKVGNRNEAITKAKELNII